MDYYAILEIERDANQDEIKKAYRKLCFKYHPDKVPETKKHLKKLIMHIQFSLIRKKDVYTICNKECHLERFFSS